MFDRLLLIVETLLLIWIVVQGEYVRFYEREVFRMNKERFEERKKWRLEKQEQTRRKIAQKTSDSSANTGSLLSAETKLPPSKTSDANAAAVPSTPTVPPTSITSISESPASGTSIPN